MGHHQHDHRGSSSGRSDASSFPGDNGSISWSTFLAGLVGSIVGGFLGSHVFGLGWIGTTLVEIGLAATVIVFMVSGRTG